MFPRIFYLSDKENLKDTIIEFLLDQNVSPDERAKRFEISCLVAETINDIRNKMWEDFRKRLIAEIWKIDKILKIEDPDEVVDECKKCEFFEIYKENWKKDSKIHIKYYIANNWRDDHCIGLYCWINKESKEERKEIFEEILMKCKEIFLNIKNNLDDSWQKMPEDGRDWGAIAKKIIGETTGWVKDIEPLNCAFWAQYNADPDKIIQFYIKNFKELYDATHEIIDRLMEECDVWKQL